MNISQLVPAPSSIVNIPTTLQITFSENVQKDTSSTGTIVVISLSDSQVVQNISINSASVSLSALRSVVTINVAGLLGGRLYQVLVPGSSFISYSRIYFAGINDSSWTFTTSGNCLCLICDCDCDCDCDCMEVESMLYVFANSFLETTTTNNFFVYLCMN